MRLWWKNNTYCRNNENEGSILATDLHPHKLDLIDHNTERLGLDIVETAPIDGRKAPNFYKRLSFDAILVDAPCSGLGLCDESQILNIQSEKKI